MKCNTYLISILVLEGGGDGFCAKLNNPPLGSVLAFFPLEGLVAQAFKASLEEAEDLSLLEGGEGWVFLACTEDSGILELGKPF
jgi:hypothetical protein